MSNQFAESEWCQWEIDLVQERRRRQGKKALVLIMYRQIDSRHMTSPLRTLLGTTPNDCLISKFQIKNKLKKVLTNVTLGECG
jgi:hypothetical protein